MCPAIDYAEVAPVYDSYVYFDEDIPFFVEECRSTVGPVLELMAGTGRVSIPLIEAGVRLTCVDSSAEMLAVLRHKLAERERGATIVRLDVTNLDLPAPFDLAFIALNSFAELVTEDEQRLALAAVHRALTPGGRFICTLHNPSVRLQTVGHGPTTVSRRPIDGGAGEVVVETDLDYDPARHLVHGLQVIELSNEEGSRIRRLEIPICFALIEPQAFEGLAREAGFEVAELYGDYQRTPFAAQTSPYMIWLLLRVSP